MVRSLGNCNKKLPTSNSRTNSEKIQQNDFDSNCTQTGTFCDIYSWIWPWTCTKFFCKFLLKKYLVAQTSYCLFGILSKSAFRKDLQRKVNTFYISVHGRRKEFFLPPDSRARLVNSGTNRQSRQDLHNRNTTLRPATFVNLCLFVTSLKYFEFRYW